MARVTGPLFCARFTFSNRSNSFDADVDIAPKRPVSLSKIRRGVMWFRDADVYIAPNRPVSLPKTRRAVMWFRDADV